MTGLLNDKTRNLSAYAEFFAMCGTCASKRRWSYLKASCTEEQSSAIFGLAQRCLSASDTLSQAESAALNGDVVKAQKSGTALADAMLKTVSYTHLTLPTILLV